MINLIYSKACYTFVGIYLEKRKTYIDWKYINDLSLKLEQAAQLLN